MTQGQLGIYVKLNKSNGDVAIQRLSPMADSTILVSNSDVIGLVRSLMQTIEPPPDVIDNVQGQYWAWHCVMSGLTDLERARDARQQSRKPDSGHASYTNASGKGANSGGSDVRR